MTLFDTGSRVRRAKSNINARTPAVFLAALCSVWLARGAETPPAAAGGADGVALAIIYDTSGSMRESVPDRDGKRLPKFVIANRALMAIGRELASFATNGEARRIDAGLFIFNQRGAKEVIKFGPLNADAITEWARTFSRPEGNTPLGAALRAAGEAVLNSPLSRKHVLVITDGINTAGPKPEEVLPGLKAQAARSGTSLSVHFVAFDVDAQVFNPIKKLGATVAGAADEKQLNTQLQFIMHRKILLEDEEPAKSK